jgi:hypothetical protein
MNIEEELKQAMSAHVADVRASSVMGQAIRRRNRSHVMRFRTAGAAALTVVVAGAFPAYTALTSGPGPAPGYGGPASAPLDPVAVPSDSGTAPSGTPTAVPSESPSDGVDLASPEPLRTEAPAPSPSDRPAFPQDLGDLGDGRAFGGIRVGYLPDHLEWGKWSGKNGFGTTSYTTSWDEPGAGPGMYGVQIVVFQGDAARSLKPRLRSYRADKAAKRVTVRGAAGVLADLGEGSEVTTADGTPTILWFLKRNIAVEVMMSPTLAGKLGVQDTERELEKIADGVRATG